MQDFHNAGGSEMQNFHNAGGSEMQDFHKGFMESVDRGSTLVVRRSSVSECTSISMVGFSPSRSENKHINTGCTVFKYYMVQFQFCV